MSSCWIERKRGEEREENFQKNHRAYLSVCLCLSICTIHTLGRARQSLDSWLQFNLIIDRKERERQTDRENDRAANIVLHQGGFFSFSFATGWQPRGFQFERAIENTMKSSSSNAQCSPERYSCVRVCVRVSRHICCIHTDIRIEMVQKWKKMTCPSLLDRRRNTYRSFFSSPCTPAFSIASTRHQLLLIFAIINEIVCPQLNLYAFTRTFFQIG